MKTTIQDGIDARKFQGLMYSLATAGYEIQERAARKKAAELAKLSPKNDSGQRGLFDEPEGTR